jgi:hypothetical protein
MSEVRLVIREAVRDCSGVVHGSLADRAIAALSADPVTLAEVEAACVRFEKPSANLGLFANLSVGLRDEPHDAGLVVVDLIARLIVIDSTYSSPGLTGEVCYHDGKCATVTPLRYHLAGDWLLTDESREWQALAERRRKERSERRSLDARAVFYGRPLLEFVARETFTAYGQRHSASTGFDDANAKQRTEEDATYETLKEIHARWLLTPRDDLGDACPRDVALERRDHIAWDLQDQAERWSLLAEPPPGLSESSFAFRYGGFGTHELVLYYELVRVLLGESWQRLDELRGAPFSAGDSGPLAVGDFLASEVSRLEVIRDQWLEAPAPEHHGRTPQSIIDRERTRLPEAISAHDAVIDADCPCCQMMAELPGPMFWHLDGSDMDDEFAFDLYRRTRKEWEEERRQWEERNRRFDAQWAERQRLVAPDSAFGDESEESIWTSSFCEEDAADAPLGVRLFGVGVRLAELIGDLRGGDNSSDSVSETRSLIAQLNRHFGNLRELLERSEPSLAEALVHPATERFAESLAAVTLARPDLSAKCNSLSSQLARLLVP